jgi:pimeloyl-ACP methyl ester carboxylesterase
MEQIKRGHYVAALAVAAMLGTTNVIAGSSDIGPSGSNFWETIPREVAEGAERGDILWMREREDPPANARAWNMIYVTEAVAGGLEYVSGEIYIPEGATSAPRNVVLWNHATVGSQDSCAPSRTSLLGYIGTDTPRVPGVETLMERGYVVVASDYQGLGTPGGSAYLNGPGQAKSSLDALRAAQNIPDANAGTTFATYGFSQGGQTSLWIAHLGAEYAPEFELIGAIGIGAASRHVDLSFVDIDIPENSGYFIGRMAGLQVGNPELRLTDIITPAGLEMLTYLSYGCFDMWGKAAAMTEPFAIPEALEPGQPWRTMLEENDAFLPIDSSIDLLLLHGDADVDVPIEVSNGLIEDICAQDGSLEYHEFPNVDHRGSVALAIEIIPDWIDARFQGKAIANNHCLAE